MILTGITKADLQRALREQSILNTVAIVCSQSAAPALQRQAMRPLRLFGERR
jgi:hypothetical protein